MAWKNVQYENGKYKTSSGGGGASALADLDDVNITSATDGQVLKYDSQNDKWVNGNGGGSSGHTYSTSEQVVGTWIDGKSLYEKTYSGLNITCTSGTYTHSNIVESDFNKIISVVSATDGYNQTPCLSVGLFSGNELALYVVSPTCVLTSFTLRYTKTTD